MSGKRNFPKPPTGLDARGRHDISEAKARRKRELQRLRMDAPEHANARNAFSPPLLSKGSHAHARGGDDKPPVWHGGTATYSRTSMTRYPRSPSPPGWFLREVAHIGTVIARGRGRARIPPAADDRTTAFSRSNQAEMPARPRTRRASSDLQTESSPQVGMLGDTIGSTQRSSLSTSSDAATSIEHSHPWSTAEWTPRPRKRLASTRDESTVQLQWAEAHQPDLSSAQGNRDKSPYGFTTPSSSRYPSVFTPRNRRAARPRPAATDGAKLYMFASDATAQVNPLATPAAQSGGSVALPAQHLNKESRTRAGLSPYDLTSLVQSQQRESSSSLPRKATRSSARRHGGDASNTPPGSNPPSMRRTPSGGSSTSGEEDHYL